MNLNKVSTKFVFVAAVHKFASQRQVFSQQTSVPKAKPEKKTPIMIKERKTKNRINSRSRWFQIKNRALRLKLCGDSYATFTFYGACRIQIRL